MKHNFNANTGASKPVGFTQKFLSIVNNLGLMTQNQLNSKLEKAAWDRDLQALVFWHKAGADIHSNWNRAVKIATGRGSAECVQYLLDNGALPNQAPRELCDLFRVGGVDWTNSLNIAGATGRTELIDRLVPFTEPQRRAGILYKMLQSAIEQGHKETVQHIVEKYKYEIGLEGIRDLRHWAKTDDMKEFVEPFVAAAKSECTPEEVLLQERSASPAVRPPGIR